MVTSQETQALEGAAGRAFTKAKPLLPPEATYTVSARKKSSSEPVFAFLRKHYGNVPLREIDSLFGFVERSTLYGGRAFTQRELSDRDVCQLNNAGIGIRLPMTNHFVKRDEYEQYLELLQKYHRPVNSIIATNDDLAKWIESVGAIESKEPDDVATAALHALFSDYPKRRYLVLPNEGEAAWTIGSVVQRLAQLNGNHDYSYSQDELIEMLKVALAAEE